MARVGSKPQFYNQELTVNDRTVIQNKDNSDTSITLGQIQCIPVANCTTASNVATKEAVLLSDSMFKGGFSISHTFARDGANVTEYLTGLTIKVIFQNSNTADSPTLNIGGVNLPITVNNKRMGANVLEGGTYTFRLTPYGQNYSWECENNGGRVKATSYAVRYADGTIKNTRRKYVFLSDSYASYSGWITDIVSYMGLQSGEWVNIAKDGIGFVPTSSGSFLGQITNYRNSISQEEADYVTDIVIAGGINDTYTEQDLTLLNNKIVEFSNYVKTYFPRALVSYGYCGYARQESSVIATRVYSARYKVSAYIKQALSDLPNCSYLVNTENVVHNKEYLGSDLLHPNNNGGIAIARTIKNALEKGSAEIQYRESSTLTAIAGTLTGGVIDATIKNDFITIHSDGFTIADSNLTFSGGNSVKIGTVNSNLFERFDPIIVKLTLGLTSSNKNTTARLYCENSNLYLIVDDIVSSSWSYETVTKPKYIKVNDINITFPAMLS